MIGAAQIIVLVVLIILTVVLVVLGIQTFFVLKDFRKTLTRANKVLEDTSHITESVSAPINSLSSILTGVKLGKIIGAILDRGEKGEKNG